MLHPLPAKDYLHKQLLDWTGLWDVTNWNKYKYIGGKNKFTLKFSDVVCSRWGIVSCIHKLMHKSL